MIDLKLLTVLLVEDEYELRRETAAFLELYCGTVIQAANGREALALFATGHPDLVISDIRMPVMDGIELATRLKETSPKTPLIFCTAFTETSYLLKAIELGAAAFVRKPVDTDELLAAMSKAALPIVQRLQIKTLSDELSAAMRAQLGNTPSQRVVVEQATHVARTPFNVLLEGETGTGKSRLANIIHTLSARRDKPFVTVQLAALPLNLIESELFGHIRGSFTGAEHNRTGLAKIADGGTIFLDDIESCPVELQAKLLRFIEDKAFMPVGSSQEMKVNVRVIAASNKKLQQETETGRFRQDLYYRLADTVISLPLLRDTKEAIAPLALKFLQETCDELESGSSPVLGEDAVQMLTNMPWPGNVRQLKSVIRRVALAAGDRITAADIAAVTDKEATVTEETIPSAPLSSLPPFPCSMNTLETWVLEQALAHCNGMRMKTAAMLGMNYYTFRRRLEKHGITCDEE
jgi:DNA-binding NtrC family response regulator